MAISTKQKVTHITKFVADFAETLAGFHHGNIVGIRVDKKRVRGIELSNYAIIFQVKTKIDKAALDTSNIIPDYIEITFPDNQTRKIATDIQASGEIELHTGIGDKTSCAEYSYGAGSIGLYVKDPLGSVFAVTNYHVVAKKLLNAGQTFYQYTTYQDNVIIEGKDGNRTGAFATGTVNKNVDVAFVKLHGELGFTNILPGGPANGIWTRDKVLSSLKGQTIRVFSLFNNGREAVVNSVLVPMLYPGTNIMINLIRLDRVISSPGDSGGLVTDTINRIVGIVMGADGDATYVVPFYEITNFKHCFPI